MTKNIKKPLISLLVILVLGIVLDVVTKQWAYHNLLTDYFHEKTEEFPACGSPEEERNRSIFIHNNSKRITVIKNFFDLRYVENCASAFNLMGNMPESFRFPFFLIIHILACLIIPYLYIKTPREQTYMLYALPFILSGAIGNLIDRIFYRFVIDFIDWYVIIGGKEHHWPTFNIADAAIVIGIGFMILQMIADFSQAKKQKA